MSRGRIPYHGDGNPNNFESRKRYVNLRKLRWGLARDISVILIIVVTITALFLRWISNFNSADKTPVVILVIFWIFAVILIVGVLKLNKFRKGYDVDISHRKEKKDESYSDET